MPIYNMNGGGSNLTYTVKFSPEKPEVTSSTKNILWIKDSFDFLNPYENEHYANCELKEIIAYKQALAETSSNKPIVANQTHAIFADNNFYVLHMDRTQYRQNSCLIINIESRSTVPFLKITFGKKSGQTEGDTKIYFAFSSLPYSEMTEGGIIEEIFEAKYQYNASKAPVYSVDEQLFNGANTISSRIASKNYKTLLIFYDKDETGTCDIDYVDGYTDAATSTKKTAYLSNGKTSQLTWGFFVKNQIIADMSGDYQSFYLITEKNKHYRVYSNPNNTTYLFTVTRETTASNPPAEGDTGELIKIGEKNVYYQSDGEKYYLISGNDFNNICITYPTNAEDIPYIQEGTLTYDFHHLGQNNGTKISDEYQYMGYEINSFEPKDLIDNSISSLKLWIIDGNNLESNIMITKPKKKRQFLSLEGVVTRLPYNSSMLKEKTPSDEVTDESIEVLVAEAGETVSHNELYFLYSELYIAELGKWIQLKTRSNQFFNLKTLLEGTLTDIYYEENTSIRDYGFFKYSNLQSCYFPNCETIGVSAFYECSKLLNVNFPVWYENQMTPVFLSGTTDNSPFAKCANIISATFGFGGIADGTITENATSTKRKITKSGFPLTAASATLETLSLPKCTNIGSGALAFYYNLKEVTLNNSKPVKIGNSAFHTCSSLSNVKNANQIETIGTSAFYSNSSLKFIDLSNVTSIGQNAFASCTNLNRIANIGHSNSQLGTIGQSAFYNTAILEINAPNCTSFGYHKTSTNIFSAYNIASSPIKGCGPYLSQITLGISNNAAAFPAILIGSLILSKATKDHFVNLVSISLSKITSIATGAFRNLQNLEQITLSPSMTSIPENAFSDCGLSVEEVAPMEEFGFEIYEFNYDNLEYGYSSETASYISGPPQFVYDEESKVYLARTDGNGDPMYEEIPGGEDKTVYEPLLDDDGNYQYEEKTYTYTVEEEGVPVTKQGTYYLYVYDRSKIVTNYDKIIYVQRPEEESIRQERIDNEVTAYGKNKRLIIKDDFYYPEMYDDWIYKYTLPVTKDTVYTFNKIYYYPKLDEQGNMQFEQIESTETINGITYYLAQNTNGNITVYYNKQDDNAILKIVKDGSTINNTNIYGYPLYRFANGRAPTIGYSSTIEQLGTNTSISITRINEFNETETSTYTPTTAEEDLSYYYKFESTNETIQREINGIIWDFPVFDTTQPIYEDSNFGTIRRRLINRQGYPIVMQADYSSEVALSRNIWDADTPTPYKPEVDSDCQLILATTTNYEGLEYVNKITTDINGDLVVYPGGNILGLRSIGKNAFKNCYNLKEVYLNCYPPNPDNLSETLDIAQAGTLGDYAFSNCTTLSIVNAPYCKNFATANGSTTTWPFSKCTQLASINLSNIVFSTKSTNNKIGTQFVSYNTKTKEYNYYHPNLKNIKFNEVLSIGPSAFYNLSYLSNVIFNKCTSIGASAFISTAIGYITQSHLMTPILASDTGNKFYDTWELDESFAAFIEIGDNYNAYKEIQLGNAYKDDVTYYILKDDGTYEEATGYAPNTTFYIINDNEEYEDAYIATNLNNIYIKNTYYVKVGENTYEIDDSDNFNPTQTYYVFTNIINNINYFSRILQIPAVTEIGENTFLNCRNLVGGNLSKIKAIPKQAFQYCINLTKLTQNTFEEDLPDYEGNVLKPYDCLRIPETTSIGENAFFGCYGISKVIFNHNIDTIGPQAFYNCSLEEVHFTPTYTINTTEDGSEELVSKALNIGTKAFQRDNVSEIPLKVYFNNYFKDDVLPVLAGENETDRTFPSGTKFIFETPEIKTYFYNNPGTWINYITQFTDKNSLTS